MTGTEISVKIKGYKCFKDEFAGFDKIMPVNIIIGRNNSEKSTLIDLIEHITKYDKGKPPSAGEVIKQFSFCKFWFKQLTL